MPSSTATTRRSPANRPPSSPNATPSAAGSDDSCSPPDGVGRRRADRSRPENVGDHVDAAFQLALAHDERRREPEDPLARGPEQDPPVQRLADDFGRAPWILVLQLDPDEQAAATDVLDRQPARTLAQRAHHLVAQAARARDQPVPLDDLEHP